MEEEHADVLSKIINRVTPVPLRIVLAANKNQSSTE